MTAIVRQFEHSLALLFFGIGMKTDLFQSCGHCWVFKTGWHIECSTFRASFLRTWNSSTEIPSPPLALFVMMLPKAHLTSNSRMSDSRWVVTRSWLSGSLTLLAFALPHFLLQGQIRLFLQVSLDFLFLHSSSLWWEEHLFWMLFLEDLISVHRTVQLQFLWR